MIANTLERMNYSLINSVGWVQASSSSVVQDLTGMRIQEISAEMKEDT